MRRRLGRSTLLRLPVLLSLWASSCAEPPDGSPIRLGEFHRIGDGLEWRVAAFADTIGLFAVKQDGSLWMWGLVSSGVGLENYHQTEGTDWLGVVGGDYTLGCLARDGSLWKVGPAGYERGCTQEVDGGPFAMATEACRLRADGTLWCYEVGVGVVGPMTQVGTETDWSKVSTRGALCGLRCPGSLWCWGANEHGQVGDGTTEIRVDPVRVGGDAPWRDVAAGRRHACAIREDGTLWCWGSNHDGALADGSGQDHHVPVQVGTEADWALVMPTCASKQSGSLWCWTKPYGNTPARAAGGEGITSMTTGGFLACGVKTDGTLWCAVLENSVLY